MRHRILLLSAALGASCGNDPTNHLADAAPGDGNGSGIDARAQVNPGIYVTDQTGAVHVFALDASGSAAPTRTIKGPTTQLALSIGIAVDHAGNIYVANRQGSAVTVYAPDATGDAAPIRTLTAPGMASPETLVLDPNDNVYVATCPGCGASAGGDIGIYHFPAGTGSSDRALTGSATGLTNPAVTLDDSGELVVANSFGGLVETFAATAAGNTAPLRSFTPAGAQNIQSEVAGGGVILLASPTDGIDVYAGSATGSASPLTALHPSTTFPLQYPGGMHVDTSGGQPVLYVVDYSGNAIYVISTTGSGAQLGVGAVRTISGSAADLSGPLDITVVH